MAIAARKSSTLPPSPLRLTSRSGTTGGPAPLGRAASTWSWNRLCASVKSQWPSGSKSGSGGTPAAESFRRADSANARRDSRQNHASYGASAVGSPSGCQTETCTARRWPGSFTCRIWIAPVPVG